MEYFLSCHWTENIIFIKNPIWLLQLYPTLFFKRPGYQGKVVALVIWLDIFE